MAASGSALSFGLVMELKTEVEGVGPAVFPSLPTADLRAEELVDRLEAVPIEEGTWGGDKIPLEGQERVGHRVDVLGDHHALGEPQVAEAHQAVDMEALADIVVP